MKLQVFCRGSVREGLGHLLRTSTFARHAQRMHEVEVIAVVEPDLDGLLTGVPYRVHRVRTEDEAIPLARAFQPDVLAFDTLSVGESTFQSLRREAFLTCSISPIFNHGGGVDLLFTRQSRAAALAGVKMFCGLEYAIFSEHCEPIDDASFERSVSRAELPVALCMGGTDAANKTLAVLKALRALEEPVTVWVLLGEGYAHSYNALVEAVRGNSRHEVIFAKTNRSMWRVMSNCAVGIMAGGLTTVEAVFAGLPTINLFDRLEHQSMLDELLDRGVCLSGGLFSDDSIQVAIDMLRQLHRDRDRVRAIRRRTHGLADRDGPLRVLRAIEQELLRKAIHGARSAAIAAQPLALSCAVAN